MTLFITCGYYDWEVIYPLFFIFVNEYCFWNKWSHSRRCMIDTCLQHRYTLKIYAKWNKPYTKGEIGHDFTYINTQIHRDRKYNRRLIKSIIELPGLREGRMVSYYFMGTEFPFGMIKSPGNK